MIAAWKLDLNGILHIFAVRPALCTWLSLIITLQTELVMNTHITVSDIRQDVSKIREEIGGKHYSVRAISIHQ